MNQNPKLCCPMCGRKPRLKRGANSEWSEIYRYQCPRGHMSTGWYKQASYAYMAWLDLIGLTERRLGEHEND